jgi:hypothetical protein
MWECLGQITTLLQVTGGSVFLLGRRWYVYLYTRELCALVLSTTTLAIVQFIPGVYLSEPCDIPFLW